MKKIFTFAFLTLLLINAKNVSALDESISTGELTTQKQIVNAKNISIPEDRFLALLDAGYTLDEVNNMDLDTYNNANLNNPNIAKTTKYLKSTTSTLNGITTTETVEVSYDEYKNSKPGHASIRASGQSETTYKLMTATVAPSTNNLMKYRVYMYWKTMPSTRSYDIIGIGYEPALVQLALGINFTHLYTIGTTTYTEYNYYAHEHQSGATAVFELPDDDISTLCEELYVEVSKKSSTTITDLEAAGDYAHATKKVTATNARNNHSMNYGTGLVLYSAISNSYDSMSAAKVYWSGSW